MNRLKKTGLDDFCGVVLLRGGLYVTRHQASRAQRRARPALYKLRDAALPTVSHGPNGSPDTAVPTVYSPYEEDLR
jgi:hypothetical protein